MATNNYALNPQPPQVFTYLGQQTAGGPIFGGVLIGDYVNNALTTPAGSAYNVPTQTLVSTVPVSAQLELQSTTGALLIMRMTTTQRNAMITLTDGMMIFNTTTATFQFYQGSSWVSLSAGAGGVVGPGGGSTDNAIARWDGAGGNTLQNSVVIVGDTGSITGVLTINADAGSAVAPTYAFTADFDTGMYHSAANTIDFATNGLRQVSIGTVATTVNYLQFIGSAAGSTVKINSLGTDTDVGIELVPKGAGQVVHPVGTVALPGITFTGDLDTGLYHSGANEVDVALNGVKSAAFTTTGFSVPVGSITAGVSGTAGTVISFPGTATNGTLILAAVNAGGAFNTTISNGTMGQSTVYTMGDIGTTTGGLVVATAAIRVKSVAGAAAAGGAAAQSFSDAFCTSGSVVVGNWVTQANAGQVIKIVPGNGSFVVTSTTDIGVGTFSYIITK